MNKKYIVVLFIILFAIVGQDASANTMMNSPSTVLDQAKTQFIQFVEPPYNVIYDQFGIANVKFTNRPASFVLSADGYRQVCIEAEASPTTTGFDLVMGKIKGVLPLAFPVANNAPLDATIRCYGVEAPDISLTLHGTPGAKDQVSFWIYLTS